MRALEVVENLTPEVMAKIELILGNKPDEEPDFRE